MKYATILFISTLALFFVSEIQNISISAQESIVIKNLIQINCLKLREQVPSLNLNCEELLSINSINSEQGISLIELQHRNKDNQKLLGENDDTEDEFKLRVEKLEKMMQSLTGNVKIMNEEIQLLKTSVNKKKNIKLDSINFRIPTGPNQNQNQNKSNNINNSNNVLKMKTFNDLELDLKLVNAENNKKNKDLDLKNILNQNHLKKNKEEDKEFTIMDIKDKQKVLVILLNL